MQVICTVHEFYKRLSGSVGIRMIEYEDGDTE